VPDGVAVGEWVLATARGATAFYDIDTPVTLAALERGDLDYLSPALIPRYDLYLSFTGGPTLARLERAYGSPMARPLYCAVDLALYRPAAAAPRWDLGYMGTYSRDRQPALERLLLEPARRWSAGRFVVAGAQYPPDVDWPPAVERIEHLPPARHRDFYTAQRFTLNITRADMIAAGYSPSVRLFEAAACGTPIISDAWAGLETFFEIGREILVADDTGEVLRLARTLPEEERRALAERARRRVLAEHTADHRAETLEMYMADLRGRRPRSPVAAATEERQRREIASLGPWFHNLHLPGGARTAPDHPLGDYPAYKWDELLPHLPADLTGWSVLDIGCNAGFYSFALAQRGARVTAIDADEHYLAQARWASRQLGLEGVVEFRQRQVYDLARLEGAFDLVLFMGVFYHLRYPLLGLDIAARLTGRLLIFQSLLMPGAEVQEQTDGLGFDERAPLARPGWPTMAFIEHRFADDPTNWWIPNRAGAEAMLRSSGLRVRALAGRELYVCEPDPTHPSCVRTWNAAEFRAATGQPWRGTPLEVVP
jgi:methyltransferase (TIGR04290 family)